MSSFGVVTVPLYSRKCPRIRLTVMCLVTNPTRECAGSIWYVGIPTSSFVVPCWRAQVSPSPPQEQSSDRNYFPEHRVNATQGPSGRGAPGRVACAPRRHHADAPPPRPGDGGGAGHAAGLVRGPPAPVERARPAAAHPAAGESGPVQQERPLAARESHGGGGACRPRGVPERPARNES